jgi:two-component system response regulator WspF
MRIAIVNDLMLAREVLQRLVLSVPDYSIAWVAEDGDVAVRKAIADRPDAILMDLVMPRVNGVEATRRIMKESPCPILVVTATIPGNYELVIQAMGAGALDAVETPTLGPAGTIENGNPLLARLAKLADASRGAVWAGVQAPRRAVESKTEYPPLILIGSSTGGPDALAAVLSAFPPGFPAAVVIAQHIAAEFAPGLAQWLAARCRLPVRTARNGDTPAAGIVLVAASNDHLELAPELNLRYTATPTTYPYRPSVDVLFTSAAAVWPRPGIAVLLTGMGSDGAEGLLRLRSLGWHTIAQDESTCVVYGMPKAAAEKRAVVEMLPLPQIGPVLVAKTQQLQ